MNKVHESPESSDSDSSIESDSDSTEYEYQISTIKIGDSSDTNKKVFSISSVKQKWTEILMVNGKQLKVELDTGAECNVVSIENSEKLGITVGPLSVLEAPVWYHFSSRSIFTGHESNTRRYK